MVALWTRGSLLQAAVASSLTFFSSNTATRPQLSPPSATAAAFVRKQVAEVLRSDPSLAGPIVRLAFHDATVRSVDPSIGGADGSIRYELDWPENRGLGKPLSVVTAIYDESSSSLSFADVLALAGAASVEASGGPHIPIRLGRQDTHREDGRFLKEPLEGGYYYSTSLPYAGLDSVGLRKYFGRLGLTEAEFVALSGAHDMGRHVSLLGMPKDCLKNLTRTCLEDAPVLLPFVTKTSQYQLSNTYFRRLLRWNDREIELGEVAFLPTDVALVVDEGLQESVRAFASDQDLFFRTFRRAYQKLVDSTATSAARF